MQVDSAPPPFSPPSPAPSHASPPPPSSVAESSYQFPHKPEGGGVSRSMSPSEFSSTSEYAAPPPRAFSYDPPAPSSGRSTPASESSRGVSGGMVGSYGGARGEDAAMSGGHRGAHVEPVLMEYSALGRQIAGGGSVQRVMGTFPFADYLSDANGMPPPEAPYPPPPHPLVFHGDSSHGELVQRHAHMHPGYQHGNPPPLHGHWSEPPPLPCCAPGAPEHHHGGHPAGPPPRVIYSSDGSRMLGAHPGQHGQPYYTPYNVGPPPPGGVHMVRSISTNSSSSSAYSDSENYGYSSSQHSGGNTSDYEGAGVCNPAYLSSTPGADGLGPYYRANADGSPVAPGHYVYGTRSSSDLHSLNGLRLEDGDGTMRQHRLHRDSTVRGGQDGGSAGSKARSGSRTSAKAIFHPSPQSMLAPHIALAARKNGGRTGAFLGTNSPGLPTDDEFAQMPTKRSRGRRPPCSPDLVLSNDPNANPSEAQIRYCGVTKTGKPKKIFLCKVPLCGKCFKRSEHLKRHVRSIHTNEKPFQCQWPSCGKYFSRHDNLNQHLRIHRSPGQSDMSFSLQLEACFGRPMDQRNGASPSDDESDEY